MSGIVGHMAYAIVDVFEVVVGRQPLLGRLPMGDGPRWESLAAKWRD